LGKDLGLEKPRGNLYIFPKWSNGSLNPGGIGVIENEYVAFLVSGDTHQ
jgi:hypothetical protein